LPYACKVLPMTTARPASSRAGSREPAPEGSAGTAAPSEPPPAPRTTGTQAAQLDQLRFLYQVLRLATTARTWDELLETVIDGTRDALHADVSSLYLLDRDG